MKNSEKNETKKLKQVHQSLIDGIQNYDLDGVSIGDGEVFVAGEKFNKGQPIPDDQNIKANSNKAPGSPEKA